MKKTTLKKILGTIAIAFVGLLTIRFIKMLPAVLKILALAANAITVYFAYNQFINQNKEDEN
tara:strand:+ start:225 stop:410 length:186 start_codon:yes stop_codon:yes gene_type:complete